MHNNRSISIIVLNFNTTELLKNTLLKLKKSASGLLYTIIIVDNGSKNSEYQALKQYLDNHKDINLLRSDTNLGFAKGNNIGIKYAIEKFRPKYILLMNSDIFIEEKKVIEMLIEKLEAYKKSGAVAVMPLVWNIHKKPVDPRYQVQIRKVEQYLDTLICNSPILKKIFRGRYNDFIFRDDMPFSKTVKANVLSGAFMLILTDFLEKINFLDEETFLYHEEVIIGKKMNKLNKFGLLDPRVCVNHLQGKSSLRSGNPFSGFIFAHKTLSQLHYIRTYLQAGYIKRTVFIAIRKVESLLLSIMLNKSVAEYRLFCRTLKSKTE